MNTLKNKILLLCPTCKRVALRQRAEYDIEGAVFVEIKCEKCQDDTESPDYYDQEGWMNIRAYDKENKPPNRKI